MKCTNFWVGLIYLFCVSVPALSQSPNDSTGVECVDQKCVDPCPGPCGFNSICVVRDKIAYCSCKPGFKGDPVTECIRIERGECAQDDQCPMDKACIDQRCLNPCKGSCGPNAYCSVAKHNAICVCLEGFLITPDGNCTSGSTPECQTNAHCPDNRACLRQKCVDPCGEVVCGNNTSCYVKNHYPVCGCNDGFLGDPLRGCVPSCSTKDNKKASQLVKTALRGMLRNLASENGPMCHSDSQKKKKYIILSDTEKTTWFSALRSCKNNLMELASVESVEEQKELEKAIKSVGYSISFLWIGGSCIENEGQFFWSSSGRSLTFTKWSSNNVHGSTENCLAVSNQTGNGYPWADRDCNEKYPYICEYY